MQHVFEKGAVTADEAVLRVVEQPGQGEIEVGHVDHQQKRHGRQRQGAPEQEIEGTRTGHRKDLGQRGPRQCEQAPVSIW
ncbi:hypothetical protein D9M68_993890 [compost metagenome]